MPNQRDPTQRFSGRVGNYVKYRPGYPPELYTLLQHEAGLNPAARIADLGSGTGLLSQLFLQHGHTVFAVEPNAEMRSAAEQQLAQKAGFFSVDGRAEASTLDTQSVDLVTAGQAFHWFDPLPTKLEVKRILRPGGQVGLIWNQRDTEGSAFQQDYEDVLGQFGTDFAAVDHRRSTPDEKIAEFFSPKAMRKYSLANHQILDANGLRGRLLSSSYAPLPGEPAYLQMMKALEQLFEKYQKGGRVVFPYQTIIYIGAV